MVAPFPLLETLLCLLLSPQNHTQLLRSPTMSSLSTKHTCSSSSSPSLPQEPSCLVDRSVIRNDEEEEAEKPVECEEEEGGRERLKRHRVEVAGRVWIPDIWGQEDLLTEWIDCSVFDASLAPKGLMSAREALVQEGRRAASCSSGLEIGNSC